METLIYEFKILNDYLIDNGVRITNHNNETLFAMTDVCKLIKEIHPARSLNNIIFYKIKPSWSRKAMKFANLRNIYLYLFSHQSDKSHDIRKYILEFNNNAYAKVIKIEISNLLNNLGKNTYEKLSYSHALVELLFSAIVEFRDSTFDYTTRSTLIKLIHKAKYLYLENKSMDDMEQYTNELFKTDITKYTENKRNIDPPSRYNKTIDINVYLSTLTTRKI